MLFFRFFKVLFHSSTANMMKTAVNNCSQLRIELGSNYISRTRGGSLYGCLRGLQSPSRSEALVAKARKPKNEGDESATSENGTSSSARPNAVEEIDAERNDLTGTFQKELHVEASESYLAYAMSVIVGRALPDVRDGLKPVHRRILYVHSGNFIAQCH